MQSTPRQIVADTICEVLSDRGRPTPALSDEMSLFADGIGLDSLDFATLVVRLEQQTGYDPFRSGDQEQLPRSLGELVSIYEQRPGNG